MTFSLIFIKRYEIITKTITWNTLSSTLFFILQVYNIQCMWCMKCNWSKNGCRSNTTYYVLCIAIECSTLVVHLICFLFFFSCATYSWTERLLVYLLTILFPLIIFSIWWFSLKFYFTCFWQCFHFLWFLWKVY